MGEIDEVVASGKWFYDGIIEKPLVIHRKPARFATSRYDNDDQLDESAPIPDTPDGYVYKCEPGPEGKTLEDAKALADAQSWGPIRWD